MSPIVDIAGQRFGNLIAIKRLGMKHNGKNRISLWETICVCGKSYITSLRSLRRGSNISCGCARTNPNALIRQREYNIYRGIIARCENRNLKAYPDYGGRGIVMCKRWRTSFDNFLKDIGRSPSLKHSVERINNNGNYTPKNCIWATQVEQCNNRRNTRHVLMNGTKMSLSQAVRKAGNVVHIECAWIRISKCGWTVEAAVSTPRIHLSPNSNDRRIQPQTGKSRATEINSSNRGAARVFR